MYIRPSQLNDALNALAKWGEGARMLAGGTDLLVQLRQDAIAPEAILDLTALDELRGVRLESGQAIIGALTTHTEIAESKALATWAPALVRACKEIGSVQIRNRGTLGGNIGNASPAGDTLPALYALDAKIHLVRAGGDRWVPISEFFLGPGQSVREATEIIAGVAFRPCGAEELGFFQKIGQRRAMRVAKASAAGILRVEGGVVEECRIALGAVAPTVIRAHSSEDFLIGRQLTSNVIERAASLAAQDCRPIDDIRSTSTYRRHIVRVLVKRGLRTITEEFSR